MEKEFEILLEHYGSKQAVADLLEITVRHLNNCLKGEHIGKPLRKLIKMYAVQVEK